MKKTDRNKDYHKQYEYNEDMDDVTKYGEFISTYFAWVPLKKQKDRVDELENMTQDNKKENK